MPGNLIVAQDIKIIKYDHSQQQIFIHIIHIIQDN